MSDRSIYTIYLIIALIITAILTKKSRSEYRFITFIMIFWTFAGSILSQDQYVIKIKGLFFELQADRIIFLIFTFYYIILWSTHREKTVIEKKCKNPLFEKLLFIFLILYFISNLTHLHDVVTIKDLIASYTRLFSFPVIYLIIKKTVDEGMVISLINALFIVSIISSLVGIYQFLFNPQFFRYGSGYLAFTGRVRANGVFRAEYYQGCFLISGLAAALVVIRNKFVKILLALLFLIAIVFTFHRASWIIALVVLIVYTFKIIKIKFWQMLFVSPVLIAMLIIIARFSPSLFASIEDEPVLTEGIFRDTITARFAMYNMALREIPKYLLFGVGSPKSEVYYHGVMRATGREDEASGEIGGIHNIYIQIAFFYGLPVAIIFSLFIIAAFVYFWIKTNLLNKYYFIPLSITLTFIMVNMSNMFYLYCEFGLLLAIFLGLYVGVFQKGIVLDGNLTNSKNAYNVK